MDYMTLKQASEKWGVSARQINSYCSANRIEGAIKVATIWLIHKSSNNPMDKRKKMLLCEISAIFLFYPNQRKDVNL